MKRITRRVQALKLKGLIDTVEESKNRGPGSIYKDLLPQIQRYNLCFSKENTRTKENPMILGSNYWVYTLRDILGLLVVAKGVSTTWATWPDMVHGTTAQKTAAQHVQKGAPPNHRLTSVLTKVNRRHNQLSSLGVIVARWTCTDRSIYVELCASTIW